ncbi:MAG: 4,5-DOPA dioxygenase extradiol [Phenylobacterium sp.]|uniref:4,5-DOPA-extradiol-dioxygenase n=1 Tax=Phenylobacterium sp. TaxID=1871053 RepID=UPI002734A32E|nr:4,5-DOPA dioxygenase extradiol [Phenylobacterium sp.]MDP3174328.1 4,5-DOPA dioxygenase extradiol [Phenylobacterium sp.]
MSELVPHMPAIFAGHGSPMNALGGAYAAVWRALGARLPRPKAVLCISAHWFVDETAVTAMEHPRTIHDFYGFPKPLYDMRYPAPGDAWLAERVADILDPVPVRHDHDWGLDHGAWSVLAHLFPAADVPVVQLSIDRRRPGSFHYELGRRLAPLREEGVLIFGSGDVVHNLSAAGQGIPDYDWAVRFNTLVKDAALAFDHAPLIEPAGPDADLAIPTPEHYLPLLYVLGAQGEDETVTFFNDEIALAAVSMLGVKIG